MKQMRYVARRKKGVSSFVIVFVFVIVFLVLPLMGFLIDRLRVEIMVNEVVNGIDSALADSYHSINNEILSSRQFVNNMGKFDYYFKESLRRTLRLDDSLYPLENSMLSGPFTIEKFSFIGDPHLPYVDPDTSIVYDRPFVEVTFTVRLKPMLFQKQILDAIGKPYQEIQATRKLTLPTS